MTHARIDAKFKSTCAQLSQQKDKRARRQTPLDDVVKGFYPGRNSCQFHAIPLNYNKHNNYDNVISNYYTLACMVNKFAHKMDETVSNNKDDEIADRVEKIGTWIKNEELPPVDNEIANRVK